MLKLTPNKLPYIFAALIFAAGLQSCSEVSANTVSVNPQTQSASKIQPSLSAAKYEEPVCFAHTSKAYDGVLSLHKTVNGQVIGKSFGVKKSSIDNVYKPFEQNLQGRYTNNNKISMSVMTQFDGEKTRRRKTVSIKGQSLRMDQIPMKSGGCKALVNAYLSRDIERRRAAEKAAKRAF